MSLLDEYHEARRGEDVARLRRVLALRAMAASGLSQRQIADDLGISQPAVSQQLRAKFTLDIDGAPAPAELLLDAAAPPLKELASHMGFSDLAVFGSVARHDVRPNSDINLLVTPPPGATLEDLSRFRKALEQTLGRHVDIATYGGLTPGVDEDILSEATPL